MHVWSAAWPRGEMLKKKNNIIIIIEGMKVSRAGAEEEGFEQVRDNGSGFRV